MTAYTNQQSNFCKFFDQLSGTSGGDTLSLDTSSENTADNTGATTIDGLGGDDHIEIGDYNGVWDPVTVDGGTGDDIVNMDGILSSFQQITVDGGADTDTIYLDVSGINPDALEFHFSSSFSFGNFSASNFEAIGLTTGGGNDDVTGGTLGDSLSTGAGFDTLHGGGGNDTLFGGNDGDQIFGGPGDDTLNGGDGDDSLFGGFGHNTYVGGNGTDTIDFTAEGSALFKGVEASLSTGDASFNDDNSDTLSSVEILVGTSYADILAGNLLGNTLYGLGGDDIIVGSPGDPGDPSDLGDFLYGGDGKDQLYGKYGDDTLDGGSNNDTLYGGDGNDHVTAGDGDDHVYGGLGADTLDGGDGKDTIDYTSNASAKIKLDLETGIQSIKDSGGYHASGETAVNFEIVLGGDADEWFIGAEDTMLEGNGGNDRLDAGSAINVDMYGGAGADRLSVATGRTSAYGGDGDDQLYGGDQDSHLNGDGGADKIYGGDGDEHINGGGFGGLGGTGADGDDLLNGAGGDDDIYGWKGKDHLTGGEGSDILAGGDVLDSTREDNLRQHGQLTTTVIEDYNQHNQDTSANTLDGGNGDDYILGANGVDTITAGDGNDAAYGGGGNDNIDTGAGNDFIAAGDGNDTIDPGLGKDSVNGDDGNDVIVVAPMSDGEIFSGGKGVDRLDMSAIGAKIVLNMLQEAVAVGATLAKVFQIEKVDGGSGVDIITGDKEDNTFHGNNGDDILNGGAGDDILDGGNGVDTADYSKASGNVTVTLASGGQQNTVADGKDTLTGIENLTGSAHNDTLTGDGGANALDGGAGNDKLNGGGGNDKITGGAGADTIDGGSGSDQFIYADATDSSSTTHDVVSHADFSSDKWDLTGNVRGIDAEITHAALNANKFDHDLTAAANATHLKAHHAVLFTPDSGTLHGKVFLIVDLNGHAGYQAHADLVVELVNAVGLNGLGANDFI